MTRTKRILTVVGTRPECMKMAPVILALRRTGVGSVTVLGTGQHRETTRQTLATFGMAPDHELSDASDLTQAETGSSLFCELDAFLDTAPQDLMLVQGDSCSAMVASLAAFYRGIPVGHVEAGLQTDEPNDPVPDELNRLVTMAASALHFAPNARARQNLLREGVDPAAVYVTGSTLIDALKMTVANAPEFLVPRQRSAYRRVASTGSPYGDGRAAGRIAALCRRFLSEATPSKRARRTTVFTPEQGLA